MASYWLSFRIHEDTVGGNTYSQRYNALVDAVILLRTKYWEETTAFIVFESASSIDTIAAKCNAVIAKSHDLVLIRALDIKDARICGLNTDTDIYGLMPYLKKV